MRDQSLVVPADRAVSSYGLRKAPAIGDNCTPSRSISPPARAAFFLDLPRLALRHYINVIYLRGYMLAVPTFDGRIADIEPVSGDR